MGKKVQSDAIEVQGHWGNFCIYAIDTCQVEKQEEEARKRKKKEKQKNNKEQPCPYSARHLHRIESEIWINKIFHTSNWSIKVNILMLQLILNSRQLWRWLRILFLLDINFSGVNWMKFSTFLSLQWLLHVLDASIS